MTTEILCDNQDCDFNKSEHCQKEHIILSNITTVSQHFWFACLDYSGTRAIPVEGSVVPEG